MQGPDGRAAAEIRPPQGDGASLSGVWILSLPVDDFDESLRLVREGGGEVLEELPASRYAIIRDPIGVCLALQAGP